MVYIFHPIEIHWQGLKINFIKKAIDARSVQVDAQSSHQVGELDFGVRYGLVS